MKTLEKLTEENVFKYFSEISKIPRGSGNEKAISDYLLNFGKSLGLESIQDDANNIIIKKPATKGYENAPTVIIQGHMDMVCEKNKDKVHDFTKDPIELVVKDDHIYANGTTLGADDGIAVAYAMAILDSNNISHPALEVLITTDEEAGMSGAMALSPEHISGKIILNLDNEEEGKLLVSCAGGIRTKSSIKIQLEDKKEAIKEFSIEVKGLKGGHSGMEIHLGKGNSNKIIGRILKNISNEISFNLASIEGGSKNNAIPREASAVISINETDKDKLFEIVSNLTKDLKNEFATKDPGLLINICETTLSNNKVISNEITQKVVDLLYMYPNGVNTESADIKGLIESSTNLGVVLMNDNEVEFDSAVRSSVFSLREDIVEKIKCITELLGGEFSSNAGYPEWPYKADSKIREICKEVFKRMYNKEPEIVAIHAGVECGLFKEKLGDLDMISFGPDLYDVHTPNEHMSISSVERCYEYLLEVLKEIK